MESSPCNTLITFVVWRSQIKNLPSSDPAMIYFPSLKNRYKSSLYIIFYSIHLFLYIFHGFPHHVEKLFNSNGSTSILGIFQIVSQQLCTKYIYWQYYLCSVCSKLLSRIFSWPQNVRKLCVLFKLLKILHFTAIIEFLTLYNADDSQKILTVKVRNA